KRFSPNSSLPSLALCVFTCPSDNPCVASSRRLAFFRGGAGKGIQGCESIHAVPQDLTVVLCGGPFLDQPSALQSLCGRGPAIGRIHCHPFLSAESTSASERNPVRARSGRASSFSGILTPRFWGNHWVHAKRPPRPLRLPSSK